MFNGVFKEFEPVADLIKAANLIIGAATLIYKVYCAIQNMRGKPCGAPAAPAPLPIESKEVDRK